MIRIAIVDDHEMVREGLRAILQTEPDFDVVAESGSADRIVELAEQARPDVVLLDARLPGVSGPEACKLLASSMPGAAVLIISTYSDTDLVNECSAAGAKGYLIKDIERFSLKESIRAVTAGMGRCHRRLPLRSSTVCARPRRTTALPIHHSASGSSRFSDWWRRDTPTGKSR
ncbi:MAG: response regulator transcription factor [Actinomycetota bacterium]|nr:response regulator transcription factor [Actinomycetota bacterium]